MRNSAVYGFGAFDWSGVVDFDVSSVEDDRQGFGSDDDSAGDDGRGDDREGRQSRDVMVAYEGVRRDEEEGHHFI